MTEWEVMTWFIFFSFVRRTALGRMGSLPTAVLD